MATRQNAVKPTPNPQTSHRIVDVKTVVNFYRKKHTILLCALNNKGSHTLKSIHRSMEQKVESLRNRVLILNDLLPETTIIKSIHQSPIISQFEKTVSHLDTLTLILKKLLLKSLGLLERSVHNAYQNLQNRVVQKTFAVYTICNKMLSEDSLASSPFATGQYGASAPAYSATVSSAPNIIEFHMRKQNNNKSLSFP
uniref:Uncharacterized protein n=1 Tax=Romanomermis culicivorax TaxID=13658 RepID=A0A915KNU8_ROMCU